MIYAVNYKWELAGGDIKVKLFKAETTAAAGVLKQLALPEHKTQVAAAVYYFL